MQPEGFYKKFNMHGHGQAFMAQHQSMGTHGQRPVHVGVPAMANPGQVSVAPFGQASLIGIPPQANQQFIYPTPMHSQFVQPGQLPQIPGNLFHSDQPALMCIPMLFNHREMIWNPQPGILVPPNTGTFFSGYQIIHHGGMPMANGYGPNPNIAHAQPQTGSPSGSNYTDSNSSGSRDNLAAHEPHVRSPGNHGNMPPVSGAMVNGGVMYGYPQHMGHMTVHQAVGGPGFQPGMPNSYAQGQGQGGRNLHPGQGIQHDNANNAGRLPTDGHMLQAVDRKPTEQGNRDQEGSAAQSRSSSLGSAFESEQPHDVDDNGGRKIDGENYSHSSSSDEAELPVGGDDHNVEELEALSRAQSGLKSIMDQVEPKSAIQQVYQGSGHNSPAVDLAGRGGSAVDGAYHDIAKDLSRTSSMSSEAKTFTAENNGNNTRETGSPFVDQGRHSSHTPDHSVMKESDEGTSPNGNQPDSSGAETAAQPSTPKSWADMASRNLAKPNAVTGAKTTGRPPTITPRSESATDRKVVDKNIVVKQPEKTNVNDIRPNVPYGGGYYRSGNVGGYAGNGASRSFYPRPAGPNQFEFPRLSRDVAETFPEDQQIYMQNLPRYVSTTMIAETMRRFGEVEDVRLRYHHNTQDMRFCFVLFKSREPVEQLLNMQEIQLGDHVAKLQRKPATNYTRYFQSQQPQQDYKRE